MRICGLEVKGESLIPILEEGNLRIFRRLDLTAPTAFLGPRKLIKEGPISKAKSGRKLSMVLCNDIIVLLEDKSLYRMVCFFAERSGMKG